MIGIFVIIYKIFLRLLTKLFSGDILKSQFNKFKSYEQKQVAFVMASQRVGHWWESDMNSRCEWVCEEQGEFHLLGD